MSIDEGLDSIVELSTQPNDLKPKKPSNRAPQGIRTFTQESQAKVLLSKAPLSPQDILLSTG